MVIDSRLTILVISNFFVFSGILIIIVRPPPMMSENLPKNGDAGLRRLEDTQFELGANHTEKALLLKEKVAYTVDISTNADLSALVNLQYNKISSTDGQNQVLEELIQETKNDRCSNSQDSLVSNVCNQVIENGSARGEPDGERKEVNGVKLEYAEESCQRKEYRRMVTEKYGVPQVQATKPFKRHGIKIAKGEVCFLLNKTSNDWWFVRNESGKEGYVPANYVKEIKNKNIVIQVRNLDRDRAVPKERNVTAASELVSHNETSIPVIFSHCATPNAIYFFTWEQSKRFLALESRLQKHYQNVVQPLKKMHFEVGFLCAVYMDNKWWRGKITEEINSREYMVKFVDIDWQGKISMDNIYPLAKEFEGCDLLKCSLHGVYPSTGDLWGHGVCNFVRNRLLEAEGIRISQKGLEMSESGAIFVILHYKVKGRWINLNEELTSVGPCIHTTPLPIQNPTRTAWKPSELPELNSTFRGIVTWVNIYGEIFLHNAKSKAKMIEIRNWLSDVYNNTEITETDYNCRPGDRCIVKYFVDNNWYRAVVEEIDGDCGQVKVLYVDYGSSEWVDIRNIRLNVLLEEVPIQAIRCTLHNIFPTLPYSSMMGKVVWPIETLDLFRELTVDKELNVCVKGRGPPVEVSLTNKTDCISAMLVSQNMAFIKHIDPHQPCFTE